MLMKLDMMKYSKPVGENLFEFDAKNAGLKELKAAKTMNESGLIVYGHDVFTNIKEIRSAIYRLEHPDS